MEGVDNPEAPWQPDWEAIDGNRFQDLCLDLLSCEGYEPQDQGIGPDGGVDAILGQTLDLPDGTAKQIRWVAQFKFKVNSEATVKPRELGNVENIMGRFQAEGFFLVTNGRVTNKAMLELRGTLNQRHPSYFISIWTRRHLEQRLVAHREIACRYFDLTHASIRATSIFEVTIDLPLEDFSDLQQRLLRHALASFLEVSVDAVRIREIYRGSTKVLIEVPKKAARLLREALEGNILDLDVFGFEPVILSVAQISTEGDMTAAEAPMYLEQTIPATLADKSLKTEPLASPTMSDRDHRFSGLYQRYYGSVLGYLVKRGFSRESARELAQDAFLRVYLSMDEFRGDNDGSFVLSTARWVASKELHAARQALNRTHLAALSEGDHGLGSPEEEFSEREEASRREKLLHDAIADLPERMRTCLLLYLSGLRYAEIQETLNLSMDAVMSGIHQARIRLQTRLGKEMIDLPGKSEEDDHD